MNLVTYFILLTKKMKCSRHSLIVVSQKRMMISLTRMKITILHKVIMNKMCSSNISRQVTLHIMELVVENLVKLLSKFLRELVSF